MNWLHRILFAAVMAVTIGFLFATLPASAKELLPPPAPKPKDEKVLPVQPGEEIIRDPRALPDGPISDDPELRLKDPRTWA